VTLITLTSDFGTSDPFAGIMKGVILGLAPGTTIVDIAHGIPPQDVQAGALVLRHAVPYFPAGTIHVAVVDPGVGGTRRALCVETTTGFLVGPDNGLLSLAAPTAAVRRIVELSEERFFLSPRSATFHGRDVFAPVAAALATGIPATALGPEVADLERLVLPLPLRRGPSLRGVVIYADRFGNLVTNVDEPALANFPRQGVSISIGPVRLRGIAPTYSAVPTGEPVAVLNSWGLLEIAVRDGSAAGHLGVDRGAPVIIE
jgi:S-adenosylmethionine hydrolase